jgi:hypothetical protein
MASASISDLVDHFKLEAEFRHDCTVEITRSLSRSRGRKMVKVERKWVKKNDLGRGTFGDVWLEKNQLGGIRAVKGVKKNLNNGIDYHKELLAMAKLSKV